MTNPARNAETATEVRDSRPKGRPKKGMIWVDLPDGRCGLFSMTEEEKVAREARSWARKQEDESPAVSAGVVARLLGDEEYARSTLAACSADTLDMIQRIAQEIVLDKKQQELGELEQEHLELQQKLAKRQQEIQRLQAAQPTA